MPSSWTIVPNGVDSAGRPLHAGAGCCENSSVEVLIELRTLIARHAHEVKGYGRLSGVRIDAAPVAALPVYSLYQPMFGIVAQGAKRIMLADRMFDCQAGEYIVGSLDLPVNTHVLRATKDAPYLAFALALDPQLIASILLEAGSVDRRSDDVLGIGVSRAPAELLEPVVRLLRLLDRPADTAFLRPMIEREIIWRLLSGDRGNEVRQIGLADSRLSKINLAIRWIREHFADTIRIEDVAKRVAMSPTSFHRHFRAATAMTPLQYQKQIRLQEARSRLTAKADDVASIGFRESLKSLAAASTRLPSRIIMFSNEADDVCDDGVREVR